MNQSSGSQSDVLFKSKIGNAALTKITIISDSTYISYFKVVPHEEVEWSSSMGPHSANAGGAVFEQLQAQVSTLLCLLIK